MNPAIQKTLTLLLLIVIGLLLKRKIKDKNSLNGIKVLILSIALPATIFVALLKVKIDSTLLILPILALVANFLLFLIIRYGFSYLSGKSINDPVSRTYALILPSFAPGLSCFPFVKDYLGEESLAYAALADIGNKVFVLIILYLIAIHWYHQTQKDHLGSSNSKLQGLLRSLIQEPVNLVILAALVMLGFGYNIESLPAFLQDGVLRLSLIMTPLVLIFIGLAVNINWGELKNIGFLLLFRSGIAFLISGFLISLVPISSTALILLAVIFPQSACSFWPFAHISAISTMEKDKNAVSNTFDFRLALNILAISLPLSTVIILSICSFQTIFVQPLLVLGLGIVLCSVGILGIYKHSTNLNRNNDFKLSFFEKGN